MTKVLQSSSWDWLKLLILAVLATLTLENSRLDVWISQLFYRHHQWILNREDQPFAFIFYDAPKALLILLALYLLIVLVISYKIPAARLQQNRSKLFLIMPPLSTRDIVYLLTVLIVVPASIAELKALTHVACPNQLQIFGGDFPYLSLWQSLNVGLPAKCFPAAHASAGFSLFGVAFLPRCRKYRLKLLLLVALLGWVMGIYKMLFGDHFFSHTLVSMLLSLAIVSALAHVFFKNAQSSPKVIKCKNQTFTSSLAKQLR